MRRGGAAAAILVMMMSIAMSGVVGSPAAGATPACPIAVCVYTGGNYDGNMFPFSGSGVTDIYWGDNSQGEGFVDDEASSFWNRGSRPDGVWQDNGWRGPFVACVLAGRKVNGLGSKNDEASSNWHGDCNSGH